MEKKIVGIIIFVIVPFFCRATHLRGGEITVQQLQCGSLNYEIILTIYTQFTRSAQRRNREHPNGLDLTCMDKSCLPGFTSILPKLLLIRPIVNSKIKKAGVG
jgi:hypothetical protein